MKNDLETLRSELNLLTMAENAGADLRQMYGEWRGACPIHKGDNKGAFAIWESRGRMRWQCFTNDCNERGGGHDEFAFLVALTGQPFVTIVEDLRNKKAPLPAQPKPPSPEELARRLEKVERELAEQKKRLDEIERWKQRQPWQYYHDNAPAWAANEWRRAGITDDWQSFWRLGATDSFSYTANDGNRYTTPTLTIPIPTEHYQDYATIRHRLLKPNDPADKYRPDMVGMGSHPFLADPDLGFDVAERLVIVEGEKKAMVTFSTLDRQGWQVIGIPGKGIWKELAGRIKGQKPIILLDPDARQQAGQMALDVGGAYVVEFNKKIDDVILQYQLTRSWLDGLFKTARFVR